MKKILFFCFYLFAISNLAFAQDWQTLYEQGQKETAAGNHKAAATTYEKALPIAKKSYQKDKKTGVDYLFNLNDLGLSYYYLGEYKKTEEIFSETIVICQEVYGDRHPNYITMLGNTAGVYKANKN